MEGVMRAREGEFWMWSTGGSWGRDGLVPVLAEKVWLHAFLPGEAQRKGDSRDEEGEVARGESAAVLVAREDLERGLRKLRELKGGLSLRWRVDSRN